MDQFLLLAAEVWTAFGVLLLIAIAGQSLVALSDWIEKRLRKYRYSNR
ncbi:hypothetical protein ACKWRH_03670 [Bradyrhizobium sp. Pa8]